MLHIYTLLRRQIAVHTLIAAGCFATDQTHVHPHKRNAIEREGDYPQERYKLIGPPSRAWAAAMYGHRSPIGIRVLPGGCSNLSASLRLANSNKPARRPCATRVGDGGICPGGWSRATGPGRSIFFRHTN